VLDESDINTKSVNDADTVGYEYIIAIIFFILFF
jgi:hypothetical protein